MVAAKAATRMSILPRLTVRRMPADAAAQEASTRIASEIPRFMPIGAVTPASPSNSPSASSRSSTIVAIPTPTTTSGQSTERVLPIRHCTAASAAKNGRGISSRPSGSTPGTASSRSAMAVAARPMSRALMASSRSRCLRMRSMYTVAAFCSSAGGVRRAVMVPQAFPRSGVDAPLEGSVSRGARGSPGGRLLGGDPALPDGMATQEQLRPEVDADPPVLASAALDVALHGLLGRAHVVGDLPDGPAARVEHEGPQLLPAEGRVLALRVLGERPLDCRGDPGSAGGDRVDGGDELVRGVVLADERRRAGVEHAVHRGGVGVPADHDRGDARLPEGLHLALERGAVLEVVVEDSDVDGVGAGAVPRELVPRGDRGDDLDAGSRAAEPGGEPVDQQPVVVQQGDARLGEPFRRARFRHASSPSGANRIQSGAPGGREGPPPIGQDSSRRSRGLASVRCWRLSRGDGAAQTASRRWIAWPTRARSIRKPSWP